MKLVLHYQGGFYGYYSPMVLIDTDKHIIAKNDDGPFGKTKEELFDITKYNHSKFLMKILTYLNAFFLLLKSKKVLDMKWMDLLMIFFYQQTKDPLDILN